MGTPESEDLVVYHDPTQPKWFFFGSVSDDCKHLIITAREAGNKANLYIADLPADGNLDAVTKDDLGRLPIKKIRDNNFDAAYSCIAEDGDILTVKTDLDAPNSKIVRFSIDKPEVENWETIIPESESAIKSCSVANGNHLLV